MGVVGAYLIYTAWQLFVGRTDPDTTMTPAMMWFFIAVFVGVGIRLLVYACRLWKQALSEEAEQKKDDPTSLK